MGVGKIENNKWIKAFGDKGCTIKAFGDKVVSDSENLSFYCNKREILSPTARKLLNIKTLLPPQNADYQRISRIIACFT